MTGGCLFNLREDPHETRDIAAELPDVLESLKQRYLELKKDGIEQRIPLSRMAAATKKYTGNYVKMLQQNRGFIGPWCTDGACSPVGEDEVQSNFAHPEILEVPYGQGGWYPGMRESMYELANQK